MVHNMKLNPKPYGMIKSGAKTIELRLYDEKRQSVAIGDEIVFTNLEDENDKIRTRVLNLHRFSSFEELYDELPLEKCGYTSENVKNASHEDMEEYYSHDEQSRYGVVGIELEVIK